MDSTLDLTSVWRGTASGKWIIFGVNLNYIASVILDTACAFNYICCFKSDLITWEETEVAFTGVSIKSSDSIQSSLEKETLRVPASGCAGGSRPRTTLSCPQVVLDDQLDRSKNCHHSVG